jgi:hypothetical protein
MAQKTRNNCKIERAEYNGELVRYIHRVQPGKFIAIHVDSYPKSQGNSRR